MNDDLVKLLEEHNATRPIPRGWEIVTASDRRVVMRRTLDGYIVEHDVGPLVYAYRCCCSLAEAAPEPA